MTLRWVATDLKTGAVLAYLPSLLVQWPIRRSVGQYETAAAQLVVDAKTDPSWERAVLEGGSVLHCYDDTPEPDGRVLRTPLWSGIVMNSVRHATPSVVDLGLATAEVYLAGRDVTDVLYTGKTIAFIIEDLIARFVADTDGIPLAVQITGATTVIDSLKYDATDNAKVYQRLQELSARDGGPEWMIEWAWSVAGDAILPTLVVADRLGSSPAPGLSPAARFTMPGCLVDAKLTRDYSSGKGANSVVAYSTGQGAVTPVSARQAAPLNGRPRWDHRYPPSGAVTSQADLDGFAARTAANMGDGAKAVALVAALASPATPRYGRDWMLGDDIAYAVGGSRYVPGATLDVIDAGGAATVDEWVLAPGQSVTFWARVGGAASWTFSCEAFTDTASATFTPNGGRLFHSAYYAEDRVTAVNNSVGYTSNGDARSLPLNAWSSSAWSYSAGPDVAWLAITVSNAAPYVAGELKVRNPSIVTVADNLIEPSLITTTGAAYSAAPTVDTVLDAGGADPTGITTVVDSSPPRGSAPRVEPIIPTFPAGLSGTARALAFELAETTIAPLLPDPPLEA